MRHLSTDKKRSAEPARLVRFIGSTERLPWSDICGHRACVLRVRTKRLGAFLVQLVFHLVPGGFSSNLIPCYVWWGPGYGVALSMPHVAALALWMFPAHNCIAAATLHWLLRQERRLARVPALGSHLYLFLCQGAIVVGSLA